MKSIYQAVLRQRHPIQLGDLAFLQAHYEPAVLQQGGRVIKPPRYIWILHEGISDAKDVVKIDLRDVEHRNVLENGLKAEQSFEWGALGMFFKRENGFELLLSSASTHRTGPNYGLPSLNLQPVKAAKSNAEVAVGNKKKIAKWWLQVAAVVLFIVLLNVIALMYLSGLNGLNFRQMEEVSLVESFSKSSAFKKPESPVDTSLETKKEVTSLEPEPVAEVENVATKSKRVELRSSAPLVHFTKESVYAQHFSKEKWEKIQKPQKKEAPVIQKVEANETAVVVGAFQTSANASEMVKSLQNRGFNARNIPSSNGKWFRVVVVSGATEATSGDFLQEIKSKINPQAWILAE